MKTKKLKSKNCKFENFHLIFMLLPPSSPFSSRHNMTTRLSLSLLVALLFFSSSLALDNGLGLTPQMGMFKREEKRNEIIHVNISLFHFFHHLLLLDHILVTLSIYMSHALVLFITFINHIIYLSSSPPVLSISASFSMCHIHPHSYTFLSPLSLSLILLPLSSLSPLPSPPPSLPLSSSLSLPFH